MSFLFYHTIADADFGSVNIFSGFYDGVNRVTTRDILTDVNAKNMLPIDMQPLVAVKSAHSRSPIVGYKTDSQVFDPAKGYTDLTTIYNFIMQATGGKPESFSDATLLKSIKAQLSAAMNNADLAKLVFELMMAQVVWEISDYADIKNVDTEFTCNSELINALVTSSLTQNGYKNETLKQESCTDKLFIELPSYIELMADDELTFFRKLPVKDQICQLYTDERMYTTNYMSACRDNKSKLLEVIGDSKHNTMKIFDNEEEFYNAVISWINGNMKKAETKTIDIDTQQYLYLLIYQMYILNWGHCVRVPLRMLAESANRSDDNLESDGASRFIMKAECELGDNACMSLREFLTDAVAAYGYEILANILIQLCRWGDRKPTCLVVGTDPEDISDRVFDLNEGITVIQRQIKGELTEKDPDKFICVGKVYAKPDFAVGFVRKVVSVDETGAEFVSLYPVFFGDYLNDFEKQGKEFISEAENKVVLSDIVGQNYSGYINETARRYVSTLGTENITLSREFNTLFALNTVLANGAEKIASFRVNSPSGLFNIANNLMMSIQVVACYNYFREYANIFSELNSIAGAVDYEAWKTLIEKEGAVLGEFRNLNKTSEVDSSTNNSEVSAESTESNIQPGTQKVRFAIDGQVAAPANIFGVAPTPGAPRSEQTSEAQSTTTSNGSTQPVERPSFVKASSEYVVICNVKLKDKIVGQVGINILAINGKQYSTYTVLDPSNVRNIPDDAEHTKDFFLIMGHVIHAFRAMASDPKKQRLFFENENAHKLFASKVAKLGEVL